MKTKIQIKKENISGFIFWTDCSEPTSLSEAQKRYSAYQKQYPKNEYRIVKVVSEKI